MSLGILPHSYELKRKIVRLKDQVNKRLLQGSQIEDGCTRKRIREHLSLGRK